MKRDEVQVTLSRVVFDNLLAEIKHHAENIGGDWEEAREQFRAAATHLADHVEEGRDA